MIDRKTVLAGLSLLAFANPLPAMAACPDARDAAALQVAALQQRLMVAGLACHAGDDYNRFVLAHRAELQRSDDDLKDYFVRKGGVAGYDAYKTRLANLAAHGPATDQDAFCTGAADAFAALARSGDLLEAAASEKLPAGEACAAPVVAESRPPVRVAMADTVVAAPAEEPPAMPYAAAPPPAPRQAAARDDAAASAPPPAPRRDALYWYYRRLYAQPGAYGGYDGR